LLQHLLSSRRVGLRPQPLSERGKSKPQAIGLGFWRCRPVALRLVRGRRAGRPPDPAAAANWLHLVLHQRHQGRASPAPAPWRTRAATETEATCPTAVGRHPRQSRPASRALLPRPPGPAESHSAELALEDAVSRVLCPGLVSSGSALPIPPQIWVCGHCLATPDLLSSPGRPAPARAGAAGLDGGAAHTDCGGQSTVVAPAGQRQRQRQSSPDLITTQTRSGPSSPAQLQGRSFVGRYR